MTPEQQRTNWEHREVIHWLDSLGVLCDCDNGWQPMPEGWEKRTVKAIGGTGEERCPRCVLVEVGGVRVRVLNTAMGLYRNNFWLPAVEVNDE
jgi:hypothetical protein